MLSKRLACEKARARLKDQLSALEKDWRSTSEHVKQLQRLKDCLREENKVVELCDLTETAIRMFRDGNAKSMQRTEDSEEQVNKLVATVEELKEDIRGKRIRFKEAVKKAKELTEINKSLLMHLSRQRELRGAPAKGKEKVDAAHRGECSSTERTIVITGIADWP